MEPTFFDDLQCDLHGIALMNMHPEDITPCFFKTYHSPLWCEMHESSPVGVGQVDYRARPSIF